MVRRGEIGFELFHAFAFGSDTDLIATFGSLDEAERAWSSVATEFLGRWDLWGMPAAWWRFEPGIPEDLRVTPHSLLTEADATDAERIEQARRRFLVQRGLDPARHRRHVPFGPD